jgi:hypothetical protein
VAVAVAVAAVTAVLAAAALAFLVKAQAATVARLGARGTEALAGQAGPTGFTTAVVHMEAALVKQVVVTVTLAELAPSALSGLALLGNSHLLTQEIYDFLHSTSRRSSFAKPHH